MRQKLLLVSFFLFGFAVAQAQDDIESEVPYEKHSVATNSFWANWFVQGNVVATSFWGSQENSVLKFSKVAKDYRTNLGFSLALGKWFTPGLGLRTKFNGVWGRTVVSEDKELNASKYWTLSQQALFNLSNMLMGYNENRTWNFIPYVGGGLGRNMSYNTYALGLTAGLLNTFRVSPRVAVNLDINYGLYGARFDGIEQHDDSRRLFKTRDRNLGVEVGLTYRLGKSSWMKTPDLDAMQALTQSEIDALNAQLADLMAENDRLNDELANAQTPTSDIQPLTPAVKIVTAPVSVFFDLNKAFITSQRDLQNVAALVEVAKQQGTRLLVTGYADSETGTTERNQQLSQQRADAVANELVKLGFDREKIDMVAVGGVDTLSPKPFNRRATVEIK